MYFIATTPFDLITRESLLPRFNIELTLYTAKKFLYL